MRAPHSPFHTLTGFGLSRARDDTHLLAMEIASPPYRFLHRSVVLSTEAAVSRLLMRHCLETACGRLTNKFPENRHD